MPLVRYRCEKCRREYPTIDGAEGCEFSHPSIEAAIICDYCVSGKLPYSILVTFDNGESKLYVREYAQ